MVGYQKLKSYICLFPLSRLVAIVFFSIHYLIKHQATMSTNNNHSSRASKDVLPKWLNSTNSEQTLPKISGDKLMKLMSNWHDITALSLSNRECTQIIDFEGLSKLRRLDISGNKLKRLQGMRNVADIGMLNVSNNNLEGRYDFAYNYSYSYCYYHPYYYYPLLTITIFNNNYLLLPYY
jgi:hypothetical protein